MSTDIKTEKREIRQKILAIRDRLNAAERERAAVVLTERILGHQWFYKSEYILCFVSRGSEIGTAEILREAFRAGKKVYVPKVLRAGKEPEMDFFRIFSLDGLQEGYRGILEPSEDAERYVCREGVAERTLMLMPGAVFDPYRNRIGYGKGFYDRYLADKPALQLRTIGIGHKCQLTTDKLPAAGTDVKPYQVICV